ncbi:MSHA biogenesis protein MshQ [Aeromonas hydrophila]|nr:MSHA biogenesis protein MshQ [Aeromonas hydrophila]
MKWLWALALFTSQVWAFDPIDTSTIFPAVAQGHHGDNNDVCHQISGYQLSQLNNPKINGTGGLPLNFCSIRPDQNNTPRCDNGAGGYKVCAITGSDIRGLPMATGNNKFPTITSVMPLLCLQGQQTALFSDYGSAAVENCTVTFPSRSTYQIKSLSVRNNGVLVLGDGDYFIDSLILDNATIRLSGSGTTRIFVNQDVKLLNTVNINAINQGSLVWVNYGDMTIDNNSKFYGYLYTDGRLTMNNNATVYGRVTARYLSMDTQSSINDYAVPPPLTCFDDGFDSAQINPDNWVVAQRNNSTLPSVQNGRLRLTQNVTDQATSATFQRLFPGAGNLVTVEFDQFAYKTFGTSGADGMAVVLSDATLTPQPGAFGGPLGYGYKPGISGFAGGWLGVGLDEYGNYANEGGSTNLGSRPQAVSIRGSGSGTSGYNYLAGTASNLSPPVDSGTNGNRPHRYRITVDSRTADSSLTKVERDTGSGYSTLVGPINMTSQSGQAAVPANFLLSLTGSTGSVTNFHEIDNVRICALRSNPVGVQIDHFQLDHSGQALTCNPETVTVNACADAACTTLIKDPVTATLSLTPTSVSNGWIGGNTVTFSGGSTTVQLRNNTATAVTIGVSGSVPTTKPFSTTLCKAGVGTPSAAACTLNFADSGFFFDVPDTYSNQPQAVAIKAVKKSDVTKLCVPGFANQSKSVKFWSSYVSPASNNYNSKISVNSSVIGTDLGSATLVPLAFDAQGQSTITVKYPDAGKVQLDARYDGTGSEAGLVMTGADQFVARPLGLCITPPQGVCAAGDSSCPVFKKAGDTFQIDIKAMAWESVNDGDICAGNQTTPNFVLNGIGLGSTLVAPNPGTNAAVGTATYNHVPASNSLNSVTQTVSEVGVFRMTATPPLAMQPEGSTVSTGYFGYTIPPASSVPVGRFVPWDFNLFSGTVTPACGGFSYMSQPFGVKMRLQARNKQGGVTLNYRDAFARGLVYLVGADNKDGIDRTDRIGSLATNWQAGEVIFDGSSRFARLAERTPSLTTPEEPFFKLRFGLRVIDGENPSITTLTGMNMNTGVSGDCQVGVTCNAKQLSIPAVVDDTMVAYYGRVLAGTDRGAASEPLSLSLLMQHYQNGAWSSNKADVCSTLSLANDGVLFTDDTQHYDVASGDLVLGTATRITVGLGAPSPGAVVGKADKGELLFNFGAPQFAVRVPYHIVLEKQPQQPRWLADPGNPNSLLGEAIFGSSRGNDRIIYRREVMH